MTIGEIRTLLVSVDSGIRHYFSMSNAEAYSYWEETHRLPLTADDQHKTEAWKFYVHRFTKTEDDVIAAAFFKALDEDPRICVRWVVDSEQGTGSDPDAGYIHHIFECEG